MKNYGSKPGTYNSVMEKYNRNTAVNRDLPAKATYELRQSNSSANQSFLCTFK